MSDSAPQRFGRAAPTLAVVDVERALAFYVQILGFEKVFENGNPVGFVILKRDDAEIHLTKNPHHKAPVHNVAHLMVTDAQRLYDQLNNAGARILKGIRDAKYGIRGFVFADPDGNRIDVGQRL